MFETNFNFVQMHIDYNGNISDTHKRMRLRRNYKNELPLVFSIAVFGPQG